MKKRTFVAVALAVIFTLALAAPVFAQDMTHSVDYDLEGTISLEKAVGHFCNTGAEMKQVIAGAGTMTKSTDVYMKAGYLDVDDVNDWVASATSTLAVTTAIKLCLPPKYVYTEEYEEGYGGYPVRVDRVYRELYEPDDAYPYDPDLWEALTKQIWAAQIIADPGFSGNLHTAFTAAHGKYAGRIYPEDDEELEDDEAFAFDLDARPRDVIIGPDYVGNFFELEAWYRTSMGTLRNFVSMSSPFSHAYLTEDITVVGRSMIRESLELLNLPPGAEAETDWWDLF